MKKWTVLLALALTMACGETNDEEGADEVSESSQSLVTTYGSRTRTGSGPYAGAVGTEVSQTITFGCGFSQPCYRPCYQPGGDNTACVGSTYYRYFFSSQPNPAGYQVSYQWNNPSSSPNGQYGTLKVRLCAQLKEIGLGTVVQDLGCQDVSAVKNGNLNFNGNWWGSKFNYASTKGYYPEFRFVYRFDPTLSAPNGTPCNNCLIPQNTVTVFHRQDTLP